MNNPDYQNQPFLTEHEVNIQNELKNSNSMAPNPNINNGLAPGNSNNDVSFS